VNAQKDFVPSTFVRVVLSVVLSLAAAVSAAQVPGGSAATATVAAASRPRIGLALGGGSAKGLAHVGVLRWFEEHRIPIDVVSGTSVGGLLGGAYATGMSPAELATLMRDTDWDLMFLSDSPFRYKTFRRKEDKRAYPSHLEFGLKQGFRLPSGLNPGQQVALMLDKIALAYSDLDSFDDLPTPFRCVATDLRTAEMVVLGNGPLALAMRATMSTPGLFTPITMGNWLLVDGGTLNNVPADVTRAMGADIVIAVNVGADKAEKDAEQSLFALLGKMIDTMMIAGSRKALASADLVIDPDLTGLNSMSWRQSEELAERGYKAAEKMSDQLLKYAVSEEDYKVFAAARQSRRRTNVPVPTRIVVTGVPAPEQGFIRRELSENIGKPVDPERLARGILRVGGTDRYEYLTYRIASGPEGPELLVFARAKSYGPPYLAVGLELNNIDSSNFAVNVSGRVTMYDTVGVGSEIRLDGILGTRQGIAGEIYEPIGRTRLFVVPRLYFDRYGRNAFSEDRMVGEYRVKRAGAGIDVGVNAGRRAELRVGYEFADVRSHLRIGNPVLPEAEGTERFASMRFVFDGQNSPVVPSQGVFLSTEVARYFATAHPVSTAQPLTVFTGPSQFWQGEISGLWMTRVHGQDRLFGRFGAGTSFGDEPLFNDFSLGGPLRMGAFNSDELRGANYLFGAGGYLKRVGRTADVLGGNIYVGGWLEAGSAFQRWSTANWHSNVSAGVILETLLGTVFAGGSVGFDGHRRLYVSIGPLFR